jgi:signal transduction histidine kinase
MQRVFHNLARNAAEAIGDQGGVCRLEVDRSENGHLVLTFSDDGPGVSEEIRGRLFESFTTHGKQGGTGLGLAIVRSIVEDHGGSVSVDSEPGRTAFTIVLPQPQPRVSTRPEAAE